MKAYLIFVKGCILAGLLAMGIPAVLLPVWGQTPGKQHFETPPLLYLSATRQYGTVYLQWSVSEAFTPLHFAIERTADRIEHTEIVSYVEPYPSEGITWYRLRISDRAGTMYYSQYALPIDTLSAGQLRIAPSPGPGHQVQLSLTHPPATPVLVTIQDRLGFTRYQQWHAPGEQIAVRFAETAQALPPGLYSAVVSSPQTYLKEKFIVE